MDDFLFKKEEEKDKAILIYARIPIKKIYQNKELTDLDKLIAERITAMTYLKGYCWVSNKVLSNMYAKDIKTIEKSIKKLKKIGFITKADYTKTGGRTQRRLYISDPAIWRGATPPNSTKRPRQIAGHNIEYEYIYEYKQNPLFDKNIKAKPLEPKELEEMAEMMEEFQ